MTRPYSTESELRVFPVRNRLRARSSRATPILRTLLVTLVIAAASCPAAAAAEAVGAGIEDQVSQGIALRRAGNDEAALSVFLDVEKRAPDSVRVLLHITTAALAAGRWTMAYDYMQKAASHKDEPYYQRHRPAIEAVERTISQRVGQFRAHGSPAGAEVRLSGELIGVLPMTSVRPIEVGAYVLEVSKPGYFSLRRPVTVSGGQSLTQELVELHEQKSSAMSPAPLGQTAMQWGPPADAAPGPQGWWRARWVTWSLAGVGLAAAATSGVAFAVREQNVAHWNDNSQCLNAGSPTATRASICSGVRNNISAAGTVGITAGVTAAVFGAGALAHWLWTNHSADAPRRVGGEAGREARCDPGVAGIVCSGSF